MQTIVNLGTGGADLNGQNGSTTSADSNDALFLDWPGDNGGNYVYLPGVAGNYLSVPDEAALDITGDIDIRVRVAMDDWTPGATTTLVSKWTSGGLSYLFRINSSNGLTLLWTANNSTVLTKNSTATPGSVFADLVAGWVRVTLDVDNGATGNDVKFWTSSDGVTWTQLGATQTTAGTTSIYSSNTEVRIGVQDTTGPIAAKVYRAQILNGIDGTTVLDIDTSVLTSGAAASFTATTGQTVTINRSTSGRKSVAVVSPVWLFGTDDRMRIDDNALLDFGASDSFTAVAVIRQWNTPSNEGRYFSKRNAASEGYEAFTVGTTLQPRLVIEDSSGTDTQPTGATMTAGSLTTIGMRVNRTTNTMDRISGATISTGTDISSIGSLENSRPFVVGTNSNVGIYQDFEFVGIAVWRRLLTDDELASALAYYTNRAA